MAANHPNPVRRGNVAGRAPQLLFWGGMALAPVAVLILLFGQSTGALRVAVVLAVLTIVMLAVSMAIRPSVDMVRVDIEHRVLDEMERIRMRARDESAMAARHTHQAIADHIYTLNETIADLRAQVDEVQSGTYFEPGPPAIGAGPGGPPGVRRTETVHVTRRTTYDDTGTVYGSRSAPPAYEPARAVEGEWQERYEDRGWSPEHPEQRALPAAHGTPAADYYDDREPYREPHREDRRPDDRYRDDRPAPDGRGERHHDDRYRDDRYSDRREVRHGDARHGEDRHRDERYRDDRYREDRHRDERPRDRYEDDRRGRHDGRYDDRGYDRGYERGPDRGYDDRGRDRGHERGYEPDRGAYDDRRGRPDDRGHDRPHIPRPRSSEW